MKKTIPILMLTAILCLSLTGCVSLQTAGPDASAAPSPAPASTAPAASIAPDSAASPQVGGSASEAPPPESGQDAMPQGLTAHYPWERVPLPAGSEFVAVSDMEDTDKYVEYTDLRLPMTKTEAVAYFEPLLQKDANYYTLDADLEYVPLEIQGAYPDAVSCTSLYACYTEETEPNIYIINISLYMPEDGETVLVAVVQVNYKTKP